MKQPCYSELPEWRVAPFFGIINKESYDVRRNGACICAASHVVQMIGDAYLAACTLGDSLLLLDRYFLSVTAREERAALNRSGQVHMEQS